MEEECFRGENYEALKRMSESELQEYQAGCDHKWGYYFGFVLAVAKSPERFHHQCALCLKVVESIVNVPYIQTPAGKRVRECEHDFISDPNLGAAYEAFQACRICGRQKWKAIGE